MPLSILDETKAYPIRPEDFPHGLDGSELESVFADNSQQRAAAKVIRDCKTRGLWKRFRANGFPEELKPGLNSLVKGGWLIEKAGWFYVTSKFVDSCCLAVCDGD